MLAVDPAVQGAKNHPIRSFILYDEVDKVDQISEIRPAPLLEVLDPSRTTTFTIIFELEYDLEQSIVHGLRPTIWNTIQPSNCVTVWRSFTRSGYSVEEKIEIAKRHLVPRQRRSTA